MGVGGTRQSGRAELVHPRKCRAGTVVLRWWCNRGWDGMMGNGNPEKVTFAFNERGAVSCQPPKTCRDPSTGAADRKEASSEKIVEGR